MKKLRGLTPLLFLLVLTGCSDDKEAWKANTPLNTTSLMNQYVTQDHYDQFKELLQSGYQEESIREMYETVKNAVSNSAGVDTFTIVSYDNGKSLLVHFTPQSNTNDQVYIQDIIELPEEIANFLEEEQNRKYK